MNYSSKDLAIVILNWNGKALLEQFLPSVITNSDKASIYVIDNASSDNSVYWLESQYPMISIIKLTTNLGYAGGYQKGLVQIEKPFYCLLNSDVKVTKGWLFPILKLFNNNQISAIQPKILDFKNPEYFEYAGAAGGLLDHLGYPYCRGRVFDTIEKDLGQYNDISEIFWASGACFFVRRDHYWEVGGLDSDYFAHQEEIDLCWRLKNRDKKIFYCGISTVYHVGGASLAYVNPQKTFLNFRNSLFSILKNKKGVNAYVALFVRMLLDGIAGIQFLLKGEWKHFIAILKAHFSFYRYFFKLLDKRSRITRGNINYNTKSVLWDYFIKNKLN